MTARPDGDGWLLPIREATGTQPVTLICIPYAGSGPDPFRAWSAGLRADIGLLAVRLPGRGRRLREPCYRDWDALLTDAFDALAAHVREPHAFYGHSFGGRLAYELAHLAAAAHPGATRHLFVSGCRSPDRPQPSPYLHTLSEPDFRAALLDMGGTAAELLASEPLMRMLLPALRADMRLAELWGDWHGTGLPVPITALYGREDRVDGRDAMDGWPAFAAGPCELIDLPGGHFFPDTHRGPLLDVINERLGGARA